MSGKAHRNGVYGGWTHAGSNRVFVRVPASLKERSDNDRHESGRSSASPAERPRTFNGNGSGPELDATPIVLVHGLSSSRSLKPLLRAFGRRPVFAPDLPGFGMSDSPIRPLDIPELADALRRWMLDNGLAPAHLVGVSFGCQVAVDLAARYPTAVERLALVGPAFDPHARTTSRLAMRWARNAPHSSPRLAPAVVHDVLDAGPWRHVRTLRHALDYRIERRLARIEVPTLVVRPERDHLVPAEWTDRVAELIPDAELVVVPKMAHTIRAKDAVRLTALLIPFLAETEPEEVDQPVG
jgi:pimeloyl-ACP methyl ester carboxylesterase